MNSKRMLVVILSTLITVGCSQQTTEHVKKEEPKEVSLDPTKLLPIGTVVKLSNMDKSVMIYGYNQIQVSTKNQFDYIGVPYPEGNISVDYNVFFNRNLIEEVLHNGYVTDEDKKIREEADREGNAY
ncbi:DUF4176 domain-containing protein [Rossellomorea marisflavi]|uniref:DUF4176 domain-containing protein n=1 Tax=Rossellomorea marisflavi TaxID=189381 RepID=UPI00215B8ABA|nr:DUF4176 domain-containing protein [Rossellomorea marisflavi]MDW4527820.1 DUF4176 domain-containing protein [Rossellomorea marisflavi]